jgi:hypothetical protein
VEVVIGEVEMEVEMEAEEVESSSGRPTERVESSKLLLADMESVEVMLSALLQDDMTMRGPSAEEVLRFG